MPPDCRTSCVGAGITQLLVTGVTTEVCVHTTTREANDRGYECLVVSDCVGSVLPRIPAGRAGDDRRPGRHLRLGRRYRGRHPRPARHHHHRSLRGSQREHATSPIPRRSTRETATHAPCDIPWWTRGDTNAFFGLGFNILVNVLTLTGLMIGVVKVPAGDVLGTVLPALGVGADPRQRLLHVPGAPAGPAREPRPTSRRCRTGRACRTCSSWSSWSCCRST